MNKRTTDIVALKKIMVERNLEKINDLSKVSGISRSTLSNILNGKSQPSAEVMNKLVDALEIPLEKAGEIFLNTAYLLRKFRNIGCPLFWWEQDEKEM